MTIERGDLVRNLSGGAVMTVDRIVGEGAKRSAQVSWHTPTGRIGCAVHALSDLIPVKRLLDARQLWTHRRLGFVERGAGI